MVVYLLRNFVYIIYNKIFFLPINFCNWIFCIASNNSLRLNDYLGEISLSTFGVDLAMYARFSSNLAHPYILVKHSVTHSLPYLSTFWMSATWMKLGRSYSLFLCKFIVFCVDISNKIRVDIRNLKSRKRIPHIYHKNSKITYGSLKHDIDDMETVVRHKQCHETYVTSNIECQWHHVTTVQWIWTLEPWSFHSSNTLVWECVHVSVQFEKYSYSLSIKSY